MSLLNPTLDYYGNRGIIVVDYGALSVDRTGLCTCTATFKTKQANWKSLMLANSARHPIFGFIGVDKYVITYEGGFAMSRVDFAGIETSSGSSGREETDPVYELVVGVSEEPIETHPDFKTMIGGTPLFPLNLARFERHSADGGIDKIASDSEPELVSAARYTFKDFEVFDANGDLNPKAKVTHYLDASQVTWRKTFNRKQSIEAVNRAGCIDTPDGPAPTLSGDRNWLNMGTTMTRRGAAFQCSTEWRASGRRGWDEQIYRR